MCKLQFEISRSSHKTKTSKMNTETCFICDSNELENMKSCTELVTMSGKSILGVVQETLGLKKLQINIEISIACHLCFELVDEIDAFENSLRKSKEKLRSKYNFGKKTKPKVEQEEDYDGNIENMEEDLDIENDFNDLVCHLESKNISFIDQFLVKSNSEHILSNINSEHEKDILKDFETYVEDLHFNTPKVIDSLESSQEWTKILLKHEIELKEFDIPGELQCFQCSKNTLFQSVKEKIQHEIDKHSKITINCFDCDLKFDNEAIAFNHECLEKSKKIPAKKTKTDFKCQQCSLIFNSELPLLYHIYQRHSKYSQIHNCQICSLHMPNIQTYRHHVLIHHGNYVFQCPDCPLYFKEDTSSQKPCQLLLEHMKIHNEEKPYQEKNEENEDYTADIKFEENYFPNKSKSIKKSNNSSYVSKSLARSYGIIPLTPEEQFKANYDMALQPPQDPSKVITSFNEVPGIVKEDALTTLDLLRTMPVQISDQDSQMKWDLVLLKSQMTNLTFGIPGESQCFECDNLLFNCLPDRFDHFVKLHTIQSFGCTICDINFQENEELFSHISKSHSSKIKAEPMHISAEYDQEMAKNGWLKCDLCPGQFSMDFSYWFHKYESHRRHNNKDLKCPVCSKTLANPMDFKRHILIIHGGFTHKCLQCGKRYSSRDSIAAHFRTHNAAEKNRENTSTIKKKKNIKVEAQTCLECGVISKSKLLLDKHVLAAHGIQIPQQCQVCHETLPDPKALVEHKRQIHSNDICYICAKSYLSLSDLNLHISRMHPEMANLGQDHENAKHKPIKLLSSRKDKTMCEICSKMVLTHNIKLHMKNHQEAQIPCPKCPRMFRWNSSLTSHLSSAHGDQIKVVTVSCEYCGKSFKDKSNLRQHRYSHTGGPHSCKTCGRGFVRKDLLNSHESKCLPSHVF